MSDEFFVQVGPLKYLAGRIDAERVTLTGQVAAFRSGPAIAATTGDALPAKDIRTQYAQEVDGLERLLEEMTEGLISWAAALRTTAENYADADAQSADALNRTGTNI